MMAVNWAQSGCPELVEGDVLAGWGGLAAEGGVNPKRPGRWLTDDPCLFLCNQYGVFGRAYWNCAVRTMFWMAAAIRIAAYGFARLVGCSLVASLPEAKRCSDAALWTNNDANSGPIRQVLDE